MQIGYAAAFTVLVTLNPPKCVISRRVPVLSNLNSAIGTECEHNPLLASTTR